MILSIEDPKTQKKFWDMILLKVDDLKFLHNDLIGFHREPAMLDADFKGMSTLVNIAKPDGSHVMYHVKVRAEKVAHHMEPKLEIHKYIHNNDEFWETQMRGKKDNVAIIEHRFFRILPNVPKGQESSAGYSGHAFRIKFNNGISITTKNLQYIGTIPPVFHDKLPDNAKFGKQPLITKVDTIGKEPNSKVPSRNS